jgi:hypothetical protein
MTGWLLAAMLCSACFGAQAQNGPLKLQEFNFDMWCQEQQNLPPARCDKRLPQDDAQFRAYVDKMEHYETQQLNGEARDRRIDRMIRNGGPTDLPQPSVAQPGRAPQ